MTRNARRRRPNPAQEKDAPPKKWRQSLELDDSEGLIDGSPRNQSDSDIDIEEDGYNELDGARVAQWQDESDAEVENESEGEEGAVEGPSGRMQPPTEGLRSIPFGSLLKARRMLEQTHADSDVSVSATDDGESSSSGAEDGGAKEEFSSKEKERTKPEKRAHKHAPIEVTSKRPVTRRRQVVNVQKIAPRDPRFSSSAGARPDEFFKQRYSFLDDLHIEELKTLKDNYKKAQKLLRSSPRDLREEREAEVERLARTLKRAESSVNRDRLQAIEISALQKAQKEEKEGRKVGKKAWHMKDSEKRGVILKARHDFLKETGGRAAVRKAIEKKQTKTSQKEKRRRPSFGGRTDPGSTSSDNHKHKRSRTT